MFPLKLGARVSSAHFLNGKKSDVIIVFKMKLWKHREYRSKNHLKDHRQNHCEDRRQENCEDCRKNRI